MDNVVNIDLHMKRHTDFDLTRIKRAAIQNFPLPVTAYLTSAFISARACVGVVFGHRLAEINGRFDDGHLIRTSDVVKAEREGRFWVLTTENSRYVLATFQCRYGRESLREFLRLSDGNHHLTPRSLQ